MGNKAPKIDNVLYLSFSHLTELPENLPNSLQELYCSVNKLTKLPENLPNSLQELCCSYNPYLYIPKKYAIRFNIKETYNYNYCAFKIQNIYKAKRRLKRLKFCRHLQDHINEFRYRPKNGGYLELIDKYRGVFII